jgi:5-formyltetrahydrofolate cyclo-ligase
MVTEEDIKRINELYHKSQNEGLTDGEKEEQQNLRKAYIEAMRGNIKSQLDSIVVQRPDGTREKLKRKKKK